MLVVLRANPPHANVLLLASAAGKKKKRNLIEGPAEIIVIDFFQLVRSQLPSLLWSVQPHSVFICKKTLEVDRVYSL